MRIRRKEEKEETRKEDNKRESVDNKLELLKYSCEVQSKIKDRITSDLVLCKLGEQDKIGVTEMTVNAYLAARQVKNVRTLAKKYEFRNGYWFETKLPKEELEYLSAIEEKVFSTFMTKIEMTAILNRNTNENTMLEILSGLRRDEVEEDIKQKAEDGMVKKLVNNMKRKETEEDIERRNKG